MQGVTKDLVTQIKKYFYKDKNSQLLKKYRFADNLKRLKETEKVFESMAKIEDELNERNNEIEKIKEEVIKTK